MSYFNSILNESACFGGKNTEKVLNVKSANMGSFFRFSVIVAAISR